MVDTKNYPFLATVDETAALLRTSRKAVYAMIERAATSGRRPHRPPRPDPHTRFARLAATRSARHRRKE